VTRLNHARSDVGHFPVALLPGGYFLFGNFANLVDKRGLYAGSLVFGETSQVLAEDGIVQTPLPGWLLFGRDGNLMAKPFDARKRESAGDAVPLGINVGTASGMGRPIFSSSAYALAFQPAVTAQVSLAWVDRRGALLSTITEPGQFTNPALSPDERFLAVGKRESGNRYRDLWLYDLERHTQTRLTFDPADDFNPTWSPDGSRIVFGTTRKGGQRDIYVKAASGVGAEQPILQSPFEKSPECWSSDSKVVLFNLQPPNGRRQVWALPMQGGAQPYVTLTGPGDIEQAQLSPDARFVAYRSNESGRPQVYVQNFPPTAARWQISTDGGYFPQWRRDGKELYFIHGGAMMAVDIRTSGEKLEAGLPQQLFDRQITTGGRNAFVVSQDGQKFIVPVQPQQAANVPITVILNWSSRLKK
jgi:dipeptidyl aminopeptidase/acylaminoacyl peptidase